MKLCGFPYFICNYHIKIYRKCYLFRMKTGYFHTCEIIAEIFTNFCKLIIMTRELRANKHDIFRLSILTFWQFFSIYFTEFLSETLWNISDWFTKLVSDVNINVYVFQKTLYSLYELTIMILLMANYFYIKPDK